MPNGRFHLAQSGFEGVDIDALALAVKEAAPKIRRHQVARENSPRIEPFAARNGFIQNLHRFPILLQVTGELVKLRHGYRSLELRHAVIRAEHFGAFAENDAAVQLEEELVIDR